MFRTSMLPSSHLDELLGHARDGRPCLLERTFLEYPSIKRFFSPHTSLFGWVVDMFNPPPLESMTLTQRAGRVFLLTLAMVVASILFAMAGAVGLYVMERGRELRDTPQFYHGLVIVLVGIAVNAACVFVLLQVKKLDSRLLPPADKK